MMSAREEAERRWPKTPDQSVADRVGIAHSREAFSQGAKWQRERAYAETDERVEAMAKALAARDRRLWEVMAEGDRAQYREFARAALAALREIGGE